MTRILVTLLVLALSAVRVAAQTPIRETVIVSSDITPDDDLRHHDHSDHRNRVLFWTGIGLILGGTIAVVGSVTWAQQSDLSNEFQSVHLGRDILPCGTDPENATLPIAECKTHRPLMWIGTGVAAAGVGLVTYSMVDDPYHSGRHAPMLKVRVKF